MQALVKAAPCLLITSFWPPHFGLADWLLLQCYFSCGLAACRLNVMPMLWGVLLLLLVHFLISWTCGKGN